KRHLQRAVQSDVVDVLTRAGQQPRILTTTDRRAEVAGAHGLRIPNPTPARKPAWEQCPTLTQATRLPRGPACRYRQTSGGRALRRPRRSDEETTGVRRAADPDGGGGRSALPSLPRPLSADG